VKFSVLADIFEKMEKTTKRLELTDLLVELFKKTPSEVVRNVVYLIQGKLRPDFEGIEIGVAEKLVIRAVYRSTAIETKRIEEAYRSEGDLGQGVSKLIEQKTQKTLFDEQSNEQS
jgi:DNA ligase-1